MKIPPFLSVLGCLLAVLPFTGLAQQPAAPLPLVTTTGSAEIRVVPDLADLSFEVEIRHADLATARKEQAARAVKVLAALRAAGVTDKELDSTQAQVSANYFDQQTQTASVRFYQVTQEFHCTLHDVTKVPDVTAAAVTAGATGVGASVLRSSEVRRHKDEARRKAVVAAREKAVGLATELGAKVGRPYAITETSASAANRYQNNYMNSQVGPGAGLDPDADNNGGGASFAAGTISLSATVSVSFVLE